MTADEFVQCEIDRIIAAAPDVPASAEPTRSLRGILAQYGTAPSAAGIDQNRAEMFANFPRSDF